MIDTMTPLQMIIASAILTVTGQIGDLAFSAIKRNFGIKDFSDLLPGHGGVLDRFDSVILTAPAVYYIMLFLIDVQV